MRRQLCRDLTDDLEYIEIIWSSKQKYDHYYIKLNGGEIYTFTNCPTTTRDSPAFLSTLVNKEEGEWDISLTRLEDL